MKIERPSFCALLAAPVLSAFVLSAGDPALAAAFAANETPGLHAIEVERFGLYVLSADVERSVRFYTTLFGKEPSVRTPALTGFDVAGGLYGIVSRETYGMDAGAGSGMRAYMRVRDIDEAHATVRARSPDALMDAEVVGEGGFRFFRLRDPDGNVLELFEFKAAGPSPRR